MYENIRLALFLAIFVISCLLILKTKWIRKKLALIISGVLCLLLCTISNLIPVENLFIDFNTPEDVFYYTNKGSIVDILHGDDSCLVYYSKGHNTFSHCFVKKDGDNYKILPRTNKKKVNRISNTNVTLDVYTILNTQDYYVSGALLSPPDTIHITNESSTKDVDVNYISENHFVYFYLNSISPGDCIEIDGQKFPLLNN